MLAHERATAERDEAEGCIGEELIFVGPTQIDVDGPTIPDDPTDDPEDPFSTSTSTSSTPTTPRRTTEPQGPVFMNRNVVALVAGLGVLVPPAGVAFAQEAAAVEGKGYPWARGRSSTPPSAPSSASPTTSSTSLTDTQHASGLFRLVVEAALASKDTSRRRPPMLERMEEDAESANAAPAMQFRAGGRLAYHEFLSSNEPSGSSAR